MALDGVIIKGTVVVLVDEDENNDHCLVAGTWGNMVVHCFMLVGLGSFEVKRMSLFWVGCARNEQIMFYVSQPCIIVCAVGYK